MNFRRSATTPSPSFIRNAGLRLRRLDPHQFPLQPVNLDDLAGSDRNANAEIIRRILHGDDRGPKRDAVLLNAGAALFVAGRARSIGEGWELAAETIDERQGASEAGRIVRPLTEGSPEPFDPPSGEYCREPTPSGGMAAICCRGFRQQNSSSPRQISVENFFQKSFCLDRFCPTPPARLGS